MGKYPYLVRTKDEILLLYSRAKHIPLDFTDDINSHLKKLITNLLQIKQCDRINTKDLSDHIKMFGKIFVGQADKCRSELFDRKLFKVKPNVTTDCLKRISSAKAVVGRPDVNWSKKCESHHHQRPQSSTAFQS